MYVFSHFDIIKHLLSKQILHSRIGKWALSLNEYPLTYMPLMAMKGKVIADFIVNHTIVETPQNHLELEAWGLYVDGCSHKNG